MHILVIAGCLALAGAQTTVDPTILIDIFGTPPPTRKPLEEVNSAIDRNLLDKIFGSPKTPNRTGTTKSIDEDSRHTRNGKVAGLPTTKPSLLQSEVFGTPPTSNSSKQRRGEASLKGDSQSTRSLKVDGVPTIKPSVLAEVFGTPPTANSSKQRFEDATPKRDPQGTRNVKVEGVPTIKPSVLAAVFGTPPTANSSSQRYEDATPKRDPQGTRNVKVEGVPTIKPSLLTETIPKPWTQPHKDVSLNGGPQGTRNNSVTGPTIAPSVLLDIFGTPAAFNSSKARYEDITVKPTEGTSMFIDKQGQPCQCVPYYLCDANNVGVDVNNASVTGYGTLDIRFGEDDNTIDRQCQESVEVCCVIPKDPSEVKPPKPLPKPDPAKVKGCGYRNPQGLGVTITGGTGAESQFGEFPWVVALLDSRTSAYAGVGVLIHPKVVMTGAHIAQKFGPGELKIRAGEWDTQTAKEIYPFEERNVQTTVSHENFMPKSLKNDIALLLLDSPLVISEHINVICMPDQEEVFDSSKNCVANGWGKTNFGLSNRYAVILKKVEQDMVPYNRCNALLKRTRLGHNFQLHNSFVCAGGEAGKDTCQGDGGAPLACPIGNNRYKLTGLVAWGIGCGQKDVPAVYTNVPLFRHWVDDKMAAWGLEATTYRISK